MQIERITPGHLEQKAPNTSGMHPTLKTDVGVKQVSDRIWLVRFMDYDLGYVDDDASDLARMLVA